MHFTPDSFRAWPTKRITLLGMSGVGKTHISSMLRGHDWFHFSGDYRIGTRYLDEPILDLIKQQAMQVPFLRDLLRNDWIDIKNNIKIHDLGPVLTFVGKLGGPEWGGLPLDEFSRRQAAYREGEIAAMRDVPGFIHKGQEIYVIGEILADKTVKGGTGWGAEFAKLCNKPLYVFDQKRNAWFKWSELDWAQCKEPVITHAHFTGTGTRFLEANGKKAITGLFERSFA